MPFEKTHERFKKILEGSGKEEERADRAMWVNEGKERRGVVAVKIMPGEKNVPAAILKVHCEGNIFTAPASQIIIA
jgi:hypothetical protein